MRYFRVIVALTLLAAIGCHTNRNAGPRVDPELMRLTKEEAFGNAEKLFEGKKWVKARRYYSHVYETYPNDPLGRRSLLRVADTYFYQGDPVNLVEAQYKYRDFINRYPGADSADYAMLQIAMIAYKQMERPDRDQTKTKEAVEKFQDMITAYPNSPHRKEADQGLRDALDRLARHEQLVARFYMRRGNYKAALGRLNGLIDTYPGYTERDSAFFDLANALQRLGREGEARLYFERVIAEFPDSPYAKRAKEKLQDLKA